MAGVSVLRLVRKRVEESGVVKVSYTGILGKGEYLVHEYTVSLMGLLLQDPPSADVYLYTGAFTVSEGSTDYCRWHSGPLHERDDPEERLYCPEHARPGGYCSRHRRSLRALYDECMSRAGQRSLEACRELDEKAGRIEYTVYLAVVGGAVKVGATRSWRLIDRLAEQAHEAFTTVAVVEGSYEARRLEQAIAKAGIAGERPSRRQRLKRAPIGQAVASLAAIAEKAARMAGFEWDGRIMRIRPPASLPPQTPPHRASGVRLRATGYWGGMLIVEDPGGGELALDTRRLLHRDSIIKLP